MYYMNLLIGIIHHTLQVCCRLFTT